MHLCSVGMSSSELNCCCGSTASCRHPLTLSLKDDVVIGCTCLCSPLFCSVPRLHG